MRVSINYSFMNIHELSIMLNEKKISSFFDNEKEYSKTKSNAISDVEAKVYVLRQRVY